MKKDGFMPFSRDLLEVKHKYTHKNTCIYKDIETKKIYIQIPTKIIFFIKLFLEIDINPIGQHVLLALLVVSIISHQCTQVSDNQWKICDTDNLCLPTGFIDSLKKIKLKKKLLTTV